MACMSLKNFFLLQLLVPIFCALYKDEMEGLMHSEPEMRLGELEMNLGNDQYSNVIPQWVNQMALKIEIFT